jgi:hypothetical protein
MAFVSSEWPALDLIHSSMKVLPGVCSQFSEVGRVNIFRESRLM